ncbi:MAG: hypothetical protein GKR96_10750 [Gammaproteobacteria bacterium]|nr:hypothetical protein [Gammaproteobacteria bacterium]
MLAGVFDHNQQGENHFFKSRYWNQRIYEKYIETRCFDCPHPLSSQKRTKKIASFLTAVDEKLDHLRRKRDALETYKRGIMQKLFSQEIRFTRDDGSAFPDWEVKELIKVLDPIFREIRKPITNYLAIGVRSHMRGTFQKTDSEPDKIAMDKLYVVRNGDLVVNITFAWEGAIAIVNQDDDGGW